MSGVTLMPTVVGKYCSYNMTIEQKPAPSVNEVLNTVRIAGTVALAQLRRRTRDLQHAKGG